MMGRHSVSEWHQANNDVIPKSHGVVVWEMVSRAIALEIERGVFDASKHEFAFLSMVARGNDILFPWDNDGEYIWMNGNGEIKEFTA